MNAENPNRAWVYLVFGCLAVVVVLGCCLVVPCVGLCGFSTYIGNNQSADVQIQATAPTTVRSGQPFDLTVTVANNSNQNDMLILVIQPLSGGSLELVSARPAPAVNQSNAFQINLSYMQLAAGQSRTVVLRLRATGQGDMPIMVRGNVGILKGRSTTVDLTIEP
ncbi:MAG: DUF11 domain-containing protein [Chloroflexi bacterium]|nr:DUF11 domain-containing protein [Chloroflexota bacterium]MBU1750611.1 DUF11 domain-containing protein [Chloroflexota bacterium]